MNVGRASLMQLWRGRRQRSYSLSSRSSCDGLRITNNIIKTFFSPYDVTVARARRTQPRGANQATFPPTATIHGSICIHIYVAMLWSEARTVSCNTNWASCDVSRPYSSFRFVWGQPPASGSGLPEGVFSLVRSQPERRQVQGSSSENRLSSQRGRVTHTWHQSEAHKCSTHSRDRKIIWMFEKKPDVTFLSFVFIECTWLINVEHPCP